jgi:hypothetical protein
MDICNPIKVYIQRDIPTDTINITFITTDKHGKRYRAKPISLDFEELNYESKPTLQIMGDVAPTFLQALAQALDENGIKTENDFKIQGLLEATKYHLEDLRRLIFKKEEIK